MTDKLKNELEELLSDLEEYMNERADAEDCTIPNEEMRFQNRIDVIKIKLSRQKQNA